MFSVGLVVEGRVEGCLLNSRKKKKKLTKQEVV